MMREVYHREKWGETNDGEGYSKKAKFCCGKKNIFRQYEPIYVFLVEFFDNGADTHTKDNIRKIYNIEKHSVHINNTHEETVRIAKALFNKNSVHFLNNFNGRFFPLFEELLKRYTDWMMRNNEVDPEDYCISAGSVPTAYGIKECKDIDYLHTNSNRVPGHKLISSHNQYGVGRCHTSIDDIVHNSENHFYRYGVKYSSLSVVKNLKEKRNEPKDAMDIKEINALLRRRLLECKIRKNIKLRDQNSRKE